MQGDAVFRGLIVIAIVLMFAQLNCAVTCAAQMCNPETGDSGQLPPCHRHKSQGQAPGSCSHPNVVTAAAAPHIEQSIFAICSEGALLSSDASLPSGPQVDITNNPALSPPPRDNFFSIVLRI